MNGIVKSLVIVTAVVGCATRSYAINKNIVTVLKAYQKKVLATKAHMVDPEIERLLKKLAGAMKDLDKEELAGCMYEEVVECMCTENVNNDILTYYVKENQLRHEEDLEYCEKRCIELKDEICERIEKQADEINRK